MGVIDAKTNLWLQSVVTNSNSHSVAVDPSNNHTYLWPRVAKLDARKHFQIVWHPGGDPQAAADPLDGGDNDFPHVFTLGADGEL